MTQTLSSRCQWRHELSVLLAQSATPATLSPAPCASCWPNRGRSGVMVILFDPVRSFGKDAHGSLRSTKMFILGNKVCGTKLIFLWQGKEFSGVMPTFWKQQQNDTAKMEQNTD
ncbi:hypothetical protein QTO34_018466 [Cnephaeus nilssonii]|uniref:Uncharacterized protein n=1 Tax=Cnephaeus nilssonii TaxID=3371016 RepID=A0AA40HZP1_CNENI|nr:hypothetical protein QTO34_018466 [Eptesicus nilssonii]